MPKRALGAVLAAALGLPAAFSGAPAAAQDYVRQECKAQIGADPMAAEPASLTARWYRRFWTGECAGLRGCFGGSPNWNEVVGHLVGRSPPAQRDAILGKACRLGPLIGLEWTRPKAVRRIDTGDLKRFNATLEKARDVSQGLDQVEAQARAKIAR